MSRPLLYVAYPMRLDLSAANAVQTYSTVRELQRLIPGMRLVVPRWLRSPSVFSRLDALHLPRPAVNKLSKWVPWAGWSYIERTLFALMLAALLLVMRLTGRGYRVLYVRDVVCAAWLAILRPLHGSRVIYEVHDLEAQHPSKAGKWPRGSWRRVLHWLDRSALLGSDHLVSLTEAFKQWVVLKRLRQESDVTVIPDAYDPAIYFPTSRDEARRTLRLPTEPAIVGYAGLTFAHRRLDLLVRAVAQVVESFPNVLLMLVGGRPEEVAEIRLLGRRLGIESRFVLTGQVSQVEAALYMNAADLLVIPDTVTRLTASPLKLFEYMAVGKPIVCKEMPALREVLSMSEAGAEVGAALYFREGDVESLANALLSVLQDSQLAARLAKRALARAEPYTYAARAALIAATTEAYL